MTVQRTPDFLVVGRPGRAGADGKNEIMNSVNKSPVEHHTDNERRLQRLLSEHDLLKKFIATHLFIHIKEAFGFPPEKYHLVFRVDGLLQAGKSIESKSEHIVEILLPDDYPDSPPVCSMLSRIFHPNISGDRIDIKEEWGSETTLVDLVVKIGQMIVFQRYSTKASLNKEAAQWAVQNKNLLPLSTVDFNPRADAAPSVPPAGTAAPAGAGRAADLKNLAASSEESSIPMEKKHTNSRSQTPEQAPGDKANDTITKREAQLPNLGERSDNGLAVGFKDAGDADTIIFEDVAAQLMKDKEPREDDTAQLSVEIEAPSAATGGKNGAREIRPIPPTNSAQGVIPQHTQKKEPQAPAQENRRVFWSENIPGEIAERKTAGFKVENIFCVRCGEKNGIKADFCSRCGAPLHTMVLRRMARMAIYVGTIVVLFLAAEVEIIVFLINP